MDNVLSELIIVKRSGQRVAFNGNKIALAIKKAFDSVYDTYDEAIVNTIYENVLKHIEDNYKDRKTINVEDVQDIIESELKTANKIDVYESFSNYRIRRATSRKLFEEKQQHKFVKAMEKLVGNFKTDSLDDPTDILLSFGKTISEEFAKSYLIDAKYVRSHDEGNIFIHNLPFYTLGATKSSYIDLSKIKVIDNYLDYIIKLLTDIKKEQYGEQTICSIDYVLVPYLLERFHTILKNYLYKYLDVEGFLEYVDFSDIAEEIETTSKIDIELSIFDKYIKTDKVLSLFKKAYSDALKELKLKLSKDIYKILSKLNNNDLKIESPRYGISFGTNSREEGKLINDALLDIYKENEFKNITLIFKIKDNHELLEKALKLVLLNKDIRFVNLTSTYNKEFLTTDYKTEAEYLPNGERIVDNISQDKWGSIGRIVIATTSINLARIALNNHTKEAFYKELESVLDLTKNELIQTFEYLSNKTRETFKYMFQENIFVDAEKVEANQKIRKALKNGTLNIGIVGLNEVTKLIDENYEDILAFIRKKLDKYSKEERLNFTLKECSTSKVMEYFLSIDKSIYGTIENVTDKPKYGKFVDSLDKEVEEKFKIMGTYQKYTNGGHLFNIEVKKSMDELNKMIDLSLKYNIGYLTMKVVDKK